MTDDITIRVHADDLAGLIRSGSDARADLETCIRDATEAAAQWRDGMNELLEQFNRFRRAVQEATGLDQPELLHDDELITRIRTAAGQPYATFSIDGWTGTAQKLSPDAERRLQNLPTVSVKVEGTYEADGPPVKQDVDPAWLDTAQQRVGEQLADDHPPINLEVDVTHLRQFQRMAAEQQAEQAQWELEQEAKAAARDDGPPTESMPPVEQPPAVDPAYTIGRVFTRGDTIPDVLGLVTRLGDVWLPEVVAVGELQYWNEQADTWQSAANLLHMHGTLWELLNADPVEQSSVAEQALVDDEDAHND